MATNATDFTRYLKKLGFIIDTSYAKVVYEYIWDPLALASMWHGSKGRAAAFFVSLARCLVQIGINLSANVISYSNDVINLFPKYINIRRGVVLTAIIGEWRIVVPWNILHPAASLLGSIGGALGMFIAPVAAVMACEYWVIKRRAVDVPALYRRNARYRYNKAGTNWRAVVVALLVSFVSNIPRGLTAAVDLDFQMGRATYIYDIFYLYDFTSAFVLYAILIWMTPAAETLNLESIHEDIVVAGGVESIND